VLPRADVHRRVLDWYAAEGRSLAFRETRDPWAILVSELMAQQTQAARAAEAWLRFVVEFPTPAALAEASPADVLRAWRGLGYNRRALALRDAAIRIVDVHGGRVPDDLEALRRLPGVGPYTARAVAALAFGQPVGAVDTNVRRVLGRVLGGAAGIEAAALQVAADELVPSDRPGLWTHALMDIGATFCKPRNPRCAECPMQPWCRFAAEASSAGAVVAPGAAPREEWAAGSAVPPAARQLRKARTVAAEPFRTTSRWLRGRILDQLRDATDGTWVTFDEAIGDHDPVAVAGALDRLARERLVELRGSSLIEARLPEA
jgi:A/G-specific adenine glycosylase